MRWVVWAIRLVIFLIVLAIALKNTVMVPITLFFDVAWQMPLVVLLLISLIVGAMLGVFAMLGKLWRAKREISRLERLLRNQTTNE